jgi:peptidoglycan/LPS O-acetylase OafA/YrhL
MLSMSWRKDTAVLSSDSHRIVALDAVRGVAILLVIIHHTGLHFPQAVGDSLARLLVGIGWAGVDLFFAISGYLITSILARELPQKSLRDFFVKRVFRIFPLYIVALVLFFVASLLTGTDRDVLHRIWINVLCLTAWAIPFVGENGVPFTITWSVSVEESAYLLFAALALLSAKRFKRSLAFVFVGAILVRVGSIALLDIEPILMYYFAPGRLDAIAAGGLLAIMSTDLRRKIDMHTLLAWAVFVAVIALASMRGREDLLVATAGYAAVAISAALLVGSVATRNSARVTFLTRLLASVGKVSYFVYLFHMFVIAAVSRVVPQTWSAAMGLWLMVIIVTVLTVVPALISWRWFEQPLISFGRRLAGKVQRGSA